jgi:nucleotide-binding universal stress UspA family protein
MKPSPPFEGRASSEGLRWILVPLDLGDGDEPRRSAIIGQARGLSAEVLLLHVMAEAKHTSEAVTPEESRARTYLDLVAMRLRAAGTRVACLVLDGPVAPTVTNAALRYGVPLIVLGCHTRPSRLARVLGPTAAAVIAAAVCPVLVVKPQTKPPQSPLRDFAADAELAGALLQRSLGGRTVEVARIVGSVGSTRLLGPDFHPRHPDAAEEHRWRRMVAGVEAGVALPPVHLYKLGFGYYVYEGHHRVAAAKTLGQLDIDAEVIEFLPLADPEASREFAARHTFELQTGLMTIEAARPQTYSVLLGIINAGSGEQSTGDARAQAQRWCAEVYQPLWRTARLRGVARLFPGERTADIIARCLTWWAETSSSGRDLPAPADVVLERFMGGAEHALSAR